MLCKTCCVFIETPGSTHACHTCHFFEKQKNNHVNISLILDNQYLCSMYLLHFLKERIFFYGREIDCGK